MNIICCSASRAIRLLLFAFLMVMAPIVIAQQPRTGSISGRVIADAGVTMARVTVRLSAQVRDAMGQVLARVTNPDREGRFVFNDLPQRAYVITASAPGYLSRRDVNAGNTYLRLGDTTTIELSKGGVISGRVADRRGEGVVMTRVVAIRVRDESGGPVVSGFTSGASGMTDDRGAYRIYGLESGSYLVGVNISRWSTGSAELTGDAPIFYPSTGRANATEVRVAAGGEVNNIDIGYRREPGRAISGTVEMEGDGAAPLDIYVTLRESPSNISIATTSLRNSLTDRQFTFRGVIDGDYVLTASGQRGAYPENVSFTSDEGRVAVRGGDVSGIKLTIRRQGGIAGSVVIEPARLPQTQACKQAQAGVPDEIMVSAELATNRATAIHFISPGVALDRNQFLIPNLSASQYRLQFNLPGDLWYPRMITAPAPGSGAQRVVDLGASPFIVPAGKTLGGITVTLAEGAASLSGRIDATNKRARIHLIPAEPQAANQLLRYAETVSDREGRFQLRHLAPGRYYAVAISLSDQPMSVSQPPKAWDAAGRAELRRLGETTKKVIELQPCQRLNDYQLRPVQ